MKAQHQIGIVARFSLLSPAEDIRTVSFSLWAVIAEALQEQKTRAALMMKGLGAMLSCNARADVGARVALLQSPILPAAMKT